MSGAAHTPIVVWKLSRYSDRLDRLEYDRETEHFYVKVIGRNSTRRDAKVSQYYQTFTCEAAAQAALAARVAGKREETERKAWETAAIAACEGIADPSVVPEAIEAIKQAKVLIGARNDNLSEAARQSNIAEAWHMLNNIAAKLERDAA